MLSFVTNFEFNVLVNVAIFISTLLFSQKIKDWFSGVPSEVRSTVKAVEAAVLDNVKAAQSGVLTQLTNTVIPPAPPAE